MDHTIIPERQTVSGPEMPERSQGLTIDLGEWAVKIYDSVMFMNKYLSIIRWAPNPVQSSHCLPPFMTFGHNLQTFQPCVHC